MKSEYFKPLISVEILERADVLMSSGEVVPVETTQPKGAELENSYRDITSFFLSGKWFD